MLGIGYGYCYSDPEFKDTPSEINFMFMVTWLNRRLFNGDWRNRAHKRRTKLFSQRQKKKTRANVNIAGLANPDKQKLVARCHLFQSKQSTARVSSQPPCAYYRLL